MPRAQLSRSNDARVDHRHSTPRPRNTIPTSHAQSMAAAGIDERNADGDPNDTDDLDAIHASDAEDDREERDSIEDEDDEEEEETEPTLKYTKLTGNLASVYRNGDSSSTCLTAGDKLVRH